MVSSRPHTKVVLAMSVDGKIADFSSSSARFGSRNDKAHLEKQIATSDAVIFGAGTLRAYGTTLTISDRQLLQNRAKVGKPPQPLHIIITNSGNINPEIHFFRQPINRCLLTTSTGLLFWRKYQAKFNDGSVAPSFGDRDREYMKFQQTLIFETPEQTVDISAALKHLKDAGIGSLAVLGGGELVASMLELELIDELWITVCPLILGGVDGVTPVGGQGFLEKNAPWLKLLSVEKIGEEVFLHYSVEGKKVIWV